MGFHTNLGNSVLQPEAFLLRLTAFSNPTFSISSSHASSPPAFAKRGVPSPQQGILLAHANSEKQALSTYMVDSVIVKPEETVSSVHDG